MAPDAYSFYYSVCVSSCPPLTSPLTVMGQYIYHHYVEFFACIRKFFFLKERKREGEREKERERRKRTKEGERENERGRESE